MTTHRIAFVRGSPRRDRRRAAPTPAHARIIPPPVPPGLEVPAGNKPYLEAHAVGTQDYVCLPAGAGFLWTMIGPRATLFNKNGKQLLTHFVGPNPAEGGTARAAWQHSEDTSAIWGQTVGSSSDPAYVSLESVPWQLLRVVGAQEGPKGGHKIAATTWIQRVAHLGRVAADHGLQLVGERRGTLVRPLCGRLHLLQ